MSIQFSGLGSGLPIQDWIDQLVSVRQKSVDKISDQKTSLNTSNSGLTTLKASFSSLQTALEKFTDAKFGSSGDVFAKNLVTTSDKDLLTATGSSLAARQSLNIFIKQLATATKAESAPGTQPGSLIDRDTKVSSLANGAVKEGNFSIYVDNQKYTIEVKKDDTVGSVLDKISSQTGVTAEVKDGKVSLSDPSRTIAVGSNADTTNFTSALALQKKDDGSYSSGKAILEINTNAKLTGDDAGFSQKIEKGSFRIGESTFTIDDNTTMQSLISKINADEKAGVSAYWDSNAGKMVLTSKKEGSYNINVENISGNFTDVLGLTSSTYDADGNVVSSKLANGSQKLGEAAILTINGTDVISPSNTVTSDISGVTGLTLNLKGVSKPDTSVNINIEQDTEQLTTAVDEFIKAFNKALSQTDTATSNEGSLHGESTLTMIRNNLRRTATSSVESSELFKTLSAIGITTGKVGATVSAETDQLVLDKEKFMKALKDNPDQVKAMLVGNGTDSGVFNKLEKIVEDSLEPTKGYFAARATSFEKEIKSVDMSLTRANEDLENYKNALTTQFRQMDQMIAKMQQQFASMKIG